METRHKQQLTNYLSRHRNGIAHTSSKESPVKSSSSASTPKTPASNKTGVRQTSVASSSSARASVLPGRTSQVKRKITINDGCLPDEILLKIFTYLDVVSLLQASQVCKRWCDVSHDDSLWQKIAQKYATKGKTNQGGAPDTKPADSSPSFHTQWKNVCIERCAAWRNERALKLVKKTRLNPFTGLPRDTETALKESGVTYQLSLVDAYGKESFSESSKVTLHRSSAAVVWHSLTFPRLQQVRRLRILAVLPLFYNDRGAVVRGRSSKKPVCGKLRKVLLIGRPAVTTETMVHASVLRHAILLQYNS